MGRGPMKRRQAHHQLFANRVDRRVGHLSEVLFEVGIKQLRLRRQRRYRRVRAHGADSFLAGGRHRRQKYRQIFLRVAKRLLAIEQRNIGSQGARLDRVEVLEHNLTFVEPVAIGPGARQGLLDLRVRNDAVLFEIDQQHLARLQAPLGDDREPQGPAKRPFRTQARRGRHR